MTTCYDATNSDVLRLDLPRIWKLIDRLAKKQIIGIPRFKSTVKPKKKR